MAPTLTGRRPAPALAALRADSPAAALVGLATLATLATLAALAGCEPAALSERTVVIASASDVSSLVPVYDLSSLDREIQPILFSGLNYAVWRDGRIGFETGGNSLSEGWEFGPDSTTLTYRLRPDARWSDGEPIDAGDVVFTYELVARPEIGSTNAYVWEELDSLVADGPHQVTFHFARRHPRMLLNSGASIIPEHVFAPYATDSLQLLEHPAITNPADALVVSGSFRVAEWRPGERLILERNPMGAAGPPRSDRIVIRVMPEESARIIELENGSVDLAFPISAAAARDVSVSPDLYTAVTGPRFYDYVIWNPAGFEPFGQVEIRRALSLAIDRVGILRGLGFDERVPAAGPYPPMFAELQAPGSKPDPYLPDSARAMLARLGWRDSDGDGVRERDGREFRIDLLTSSGRRDRVDAAQIIRAQLAEVGVDVRLRLVESQTLLELVYESRDFQAALTGWSVTLDPSYLVDHLWPAETTYNVTGYSNAALDSLIPLALTAPTAEAATRFWREAARIIAADRPYAFLWFYGEVAGINPRLQGVTVDMLGVFHGMHRWQIDRR